MTTKDELWWCDDCYMWAPRDHKPRPTPMSARLRRRLKSLLHKLTVDVAYWIFNAITGGYDADDRPAFPPPEGYRKNWSGCSWANPDDEVPQ